MEMDQNIFYDEFKNKLIDLENALIDIKNGNNETENINEIFRAIHTIKGTADLLYMFDIVGLTHKSEDILTEIRKNNMKIDSELCSLFLEFKDYISLSVDNTSMGIFDDTVCENLTIYFDKAFTDYLQKLLTGDIDKVEKQNILVVDSSTITRYTIKQFGQEAGYNVFMSDNGISAFEKIKTKDIDLVFCDLVTTNIGVKTLIANIRSSIYYDTIPIVMIVDKIDEKLKKYGKQIEAKAWLHKPIDKNQLSVILKKLLA